MKEKTCKICGQTFHLKYFRGASVICWECEFELDKHKIKTNGERNRLLING